MKITPRKIFIKATADEKVPEGLVGVFNGKLELPKDVPTKKIMSSKTVESTEEVEEVVMKGIRIGDTIYKNWKEIEEAGVSSKGYENVFDTVKTNIPSFSEVPTEIEVPDIELEGFVLGLPNNESHGMIKDTSGMESKEVSRHHYHVVNQEQIKNLPKEAGRFVKAKNGQKRTYYCNGAKWLWNK